MTPEERELLRLLALRARWPFNGSREEFGTDLKLDRAIEKATEAAFRRPVVLRQIDGNEQQAADDVDEAADPPAVVRSES